MGEYHPRSFWSGPSETRSVQQRLRAIFSQYRPKLGRVVLFKKNYYRKFIIYYRLHVCMPMGIAGKSEFDTRYSHVYFTYLGFAMYVLES